MRPQDTPRNLHGNGASLALAAFLYRWRWAFTALLVASIAGVFASGVGRVARFSSDVAGLADTSNGDGAVKPLFFDPSMDVWFGEEDEAVSTFYGIEDAFVAEDFVIVAFRNEGDPHGVFARDSLATIARLTDDFLTIPGVRHVRSLTYNPWIRWGTITDELGSEEGLIISDLVEGDPAALTDDEVVERMIATLGAIRTAERVGEDHVRAVLGADANFADHIGEPLLLGTILDETGTTTAIQVQVLRPRVDAAEVAQTFADETAARVGPSLSSIERQRSVLRGIEHFLRVEQGLAVPTPQRAELTEWIESLPRGDERDALALALADPNKNFMNGPDGQLVRKFFEYDRVDRGYVDRSAPADPLEAPAGFVPQAASGFTYHLGGLPLFERNFETVGIADGKFVPLMFLIIVVVLLVVFRRVSGVIVPFAVVFGGIMAMVGTAFATGNLLNNLTMMSPNMLTAVGIADAIHLVAAYVLLRSQHDDKRTLIVEVIRRNALPVFLTTLTTAVGFYSLTVSKLEPVQMLGTMASIGTFFAWALSMTVVPALLSLVPLKKRDAGQPLPPGRFERIFSHARSERLVDAIVRVRVGVLSVAGVLLVVALYGLTRVEIDSDFRGFFPDDNQTMSDFRWIEDHMGGVGDLELVFRGVGEDEAPALSADEEARLRALELAAAGTRIAPAEFDPLDDDERAELASLSARQAAWNTQRIGVAEPFLRSLEAFEGRLREEMAVPDSELAVVTDFISPLDTLRKIHQVQHENRAEFYRVPGAADVAAELREPTLDYDEWTQEWSLTPAQDASTLVAQYYLQYESGARPGEALWTQLSADRKQLRMQGRIRQSSSLAHLAAFERIEEIARTEFPELVASTEGLVGDADAPAQLTLSGKTLLFARTTQLFTRGFIESMSIALATITLLIGILFRSVRFAIVSLVPNVLPIVTPLAAFGLLGIPLDGPAILVSSVALGVCVDDTIHFFTKFDRARRAGFAPRDALTHVFTEAGAALSVTTVVLVIGFSTLLLSDFKPNFQMGALASVMIVIAWVADFVVTSAILSYAPTSVGAKQPAVASPTTPAPAGA